MITGDLSFGPISFISSESELHSVAQDLLFSVKYYKKQCVSLHFSSSSHRHRLFESVFKEFVRNSPIQEKLLAMWMVNWVFTCAIDEDGKTVSLAKSALSLGFTQGKLTQSMKLTPLFFDLSTIPIRKLMLIRLILEGKVATEYEVVSLEEVKTALRLLGIRNQNHLFAALSALVHTTESGFPHPDHNCESQIFDFERFCAKTMTGKVGDWDEAMFRAISIIEKERNSLYVDTAEKCAALTEFFVQEMYSKIYETVISFGNEMMKETSQREILVLDSADFQYKSVGNYGNLVWNYISEKEKATLFSCLVREELSKYEYEGVPYHSFSSFPDDSFVTFCEESLPIILQNSSIEASEGKYDTSVVSVLNEKVIVSLQSKVAVFPISSLRFRSLLQCDLKVSRLVDQFIEALTYTLTSELSALNPELIISKVIHKSASGFSVVQSPSHLLFHIVPIIQFYDKLKNARMHYVLHSHEKRTHTTEDRYRILEITKFYKENFTASCSYLELNEVFYQRFSPGNRLCVTDIPDIMDYLGYQTSEYYCGFTQFFMKGKESNAAVELVRRLSRKKLKQVISAVKALTILFSKRNSSYDSLHDQYCSPQFPSLPISVIANFPPPQQLLPRPVYPVSSEWKDVSFQCESPLDIVTTNLPSQYPAPSPPLSRLRSQTSISDLSEVEELALRLDILEEDVERYWTNATMNSARVIHVLDVYQRLVAGASPKRIRSRSGLPSAKR